MKTDTDVNPPGGWGVGSKEPTQIFIIALQHRRNVLWYLYFGSKSLQFIEKITFNARGISVGLPFAHFCENSPEFPPLFL